MTVSNIGWLRLAFEMMLCWEFTGEQTTLIDLVGLVRLTQHTCTCGAPVLGSLVSRIVFGSSMKLPPEG